MSKRTKAFKKHHKDGYIYNRYSNYYMNKRNEYPEDHYDNEEFNFFDSIADNSFINKKGIKVNVNICEWPGNQLEFIEELNEIRETHCSKTGKIKILVPKSGSTSWGGRMFAGEYRKSITIWAWESIRTNCPGCKDCLTKKQMKKMGITK